MSATGRVSLEAALRALLDHGSAGAAVLDREGRHLFVTRDYEEAHGVATGSLAGLTYEDVLTPEGVRCARAAADAAQETGRAAFDYAVPGRGTISGDVLLLDPSDEHRLYGVVLRTVEQDEQPEVRELRKRLGDAERRGRIGTWVWEPTTDRVWWSQELARIYGRETRREGAPVPLADGLDHQHPRDREMVAAELEKAAATGEPFAFEHRIVTADHRLRWMSCRGIVEVHDDGRVVVRGTDQDVTERHVVRDQLSRLARRNQMLLESVSEGILGLDRRGRITFANSAALRMLRCERPELRAVTLVESLAMPGAAPAPHAVLTTLSDGVERHVERARLHRPAEAPLAVDFTCTALLGPKRRIEGAVLALRDRSLRDRYEERFAATVEELRLVDAHRQLLLADLVAAQELERRRVAAEIHDDAVQAMSAVALRAEQLAGSLEPEAAEQLRRLTDVVRDATGRLRQMLVRLQPPELETAIGAAIEAYASSASLPFALSVADRLDEQPSMATRIVLYRIAQEALRNAAKHARASTVCAVLEPEGPRVRLTIADDGVGIEPELLRTAQPGHLGIDTMRYRAELAGGQCMIESTPGAGTTVVVELPRQEHER